jgi:hypothetical protein
MATATFSSTEAFSFGWNKFKENPWFYLGVTLITGVITGAVNSYTPDGEFSAAAGLLMLLSFVISSIVGIGTARIAIKAARGEQPELNDLTYALNDGKLLLQYIVLSLVMGLIIGLGLIALIIPGIYFIVTYSLATYYLVDHKSDFSTALKKSAEATAGNKWNLIGFGLLMVIINIAGAILLLVGLLVTMPVTLIAGGYVYNTLAGKAPKKEKEELAA